VQVRNNIKFYFFPTITMAKGEEVSKKDTASLIALNAQSHYALHKLLQCGYFLFLAIVLRTQDEVMKQASVEETVVDEAMELVLFLNALPSHSCCVESFR
jgi:hypothetical protein